MKGKGMKQYEPWSKDADVFPLEFSDQKSMHLPMSGRLREDSL